MWRPVFLAVLTLSSALAAQPAHRAQTLGVVRFETSCAKAAQPGFNRAVALLHSFGFGDAARAFSDVLATDSTCVMAQWGLALTAWGNPFAAGIKPQAQLARGFAAVERGRAMRGGTARERAYLDAAGRLYDDYQHIDQPTRLLAYRDAMAKVAAQYPRDDEASIFYAAALAFSADPNDKTYASQQKAGAILERLVTRLPDHPGVAHYLIHTYDVPALASKGLGAADRYAVIAPSSAHALHMPSHTYTRVGKWNESIATNVRSAKAAETEGSIGEALHATDYLMYANLQLCRDTAAARLLDVGTSLATRFDPNVIGTGAPPAAGFFAIAAIPARYAVERGDWKAASLLEVRPSPFPFADAITWFAKGVGAARGGDTTSSADAVVHLEQLRDALATRDESYWAAQVDIQRRAVLAWTTWARGAHADAIAEARGAAEAEAATEKNAMTPGPLLPAREMLGDMLLASGDAAGALSAFEQTLAVEPGRFRALDGARRAARAARNEDAVRRYDRALPVCHTRGSGGSDR